MVSRALLLGLLALPINAWAISEDNYADVRGSVVQPWYETTRHMSTFEGVDGVHLSAVQFPAANNDVALIILGGRTESHIKYAEVFYDLQPWGYTLYSYDHRGQGLSGRLLDNPQKQYVDDFEDYVADLKTYVDTVVKPHQHKKIFLMAHSMGGLIATLFAQEHPRDVDAYVLCAPMHRFYTKPFPEPVADGLGWFGVATFQGDEYGPSQGDAKPQDFSTQHVSTSQPRWEFNTGLLEKNPGLIMGGVTYRWVKQAFGAASKARRDAKKFMPPLLLFQAGNDKVVRTDGQDTVCKGARECNKVMFADGMHELLQEVDAIRGPLLTQAHDFFETQRTAPALDDAVGCNQARVGAWWVVLLVLWPRRPRVKAAR